MRISYLASAALAVCLLPLASQAYAGSSSQSITYGSGTYGSTGHSSHSSHASGMHSSGSHSSHSASSSMSTRYGSGSTSPCPSGSTRSSDGFCISSGSSSSVGISSGTSFATSGGYTSPPSMQSVSSGYTSPPSMQSVSSGYTSPPSMAPSFGMGASTVVPFRTTVNNISKYRINGMSSNEFLSETSCPTSVYNPGGAKVLGCYSVVKPVPAPVYRPAPVVVPQVHYQQVRVVRPIIYVRYPVPTPVPYPVYQQQYNVGGCGTAYSRYGNNWPGGCGGW